MFYQVNGFKLAYQSEGQGIPLLLIHGFPLNSQMWEPQIRSLSNQASVLAPDLRGHGDSEPVEGPYSMDMLADDCISLLDALDIEQPAVVCGLSMGGYITLAFYRRHPDRVRGLILAATRAGADSPEGKANRDKAIAKAKEEGTTAIASSMLPKMLAPKTYESKPDLVEHVDNIMTSTSVPGIVGALEGMKQRPDSTPLLGNINVPTLILHGEDDQLIPAQDAQEMHAAIADSSLNLISNAGHLLNLEQPEKFNHLVREFVENL
jgi:pimeloyl-ACP methyl ester carboxylesterase